jgi:hypothetical protein
MGIRPIAGYSQLIPDRSAETYIQLTNPQGEDRAPYCQVKAIPHGSLPMPTSLISVAAPSSDAAAGAAKVFREVASGARTDRVQLHTAIAALRAGDVLMVTRLDRGPLPATC